MREIEGGEIEGREIEGSEIDKGERNSAQSVQERMKEGGDNGWRQPTV